MYVSQNHPALRLGKPAKTRLGETLGISLGKYQAKPKYATENRRVS